MVSYNFRNLFSKVLNIKNIKNILNILSLITYLYLFFLLMNYQLTKLLFYIILLSLGFLFFKNYIFIISFIIIIYNVMNLHNTIENLDFNAKFESVKNNIKEHEKNSKDDSLKCCNKKTKGNINPNETGKFKDHIKNKRNSTEQMLDDYKNKIRVNPFIDMSEDVKNVVNLNLKNVE